MKKEERAMEKTLKSNAENTESNAKNAKSNVKSVKIKERFGSVDNARGLLVLMFFITWTWNNGIFQFIPTWMKHNGAVAGIPFLEFLNFSLMDLGPPAFFFVIGLTMFKAFSSRVAKDGKKNAATRYLCRNALFFTGCYMGVYVGGKLSGSTFDGWDNMNSIAFTGLMLTPFVYVDFIRERSWVRLLSGAAILAVYYIFKTEIDRVSGHAGGVAACIGYAGFTLIVSFVGDVSRKKGWKGVLLYLSASVGIFIAAFLADKFLERASYGNYNMTYMIMSLLAMNLVWLLLYVLDKLFIKNRPIPILASLGRSLIFFTLLSWILPSILGDLAVKYVGGGTATVLSLVAAELVGLAIYAAVGFIFEKKKIVIKI
jgi:hypothetical protein